MNNADFLSNEAIQILAKKYEFYRAHLPDSDPFDLTG
jgi:hypothetical protein